MTLIRRPPPGVGSRLQTLLLDDGPFGRLLALVVLAIAWVATWRPQVDPDAGWHLLVGRQVLADGGPARVDSITWLDPGGPFIAHSWAWDTLMELAYRVGGLSAISVAGAAAGALAVSLMWAILRTFDHPRSPFVRAVLVLIAVLGAAPVWNPRAQIWDLVFVLWAVLGWSTYLRTGRHTVLFTMPIAAILWANLHGGGVLALPISAIALATAVPLGRRWGTWPSRPVAPLAASVGLAMVAFLANPYGPDTLRYWALVLFSGPSQRFIAEWQTPDMKQVGFLVFRVVLAIAPLLTLGLPRRDRDPLFLLLAAGWTVIALGMARLVLLAMPLVVLAIAPTLDGLVARWTDRNEPPAVGSGASPDKGLDTRGARVRQLPSPVLAVFGLLLVFVIAIGVVRIAPSAQDAALRSEFPVEAVNDLIAARCDGLILNYYNWGGYLAWRWGHRVGAYGNSDSIGDANLEEQARLLALTVDPRQFLERTGATLMLIPSEGPLDRWVVESGGWTVIHRDDMAVLWERSDRATCTR